VEGPIVAFERYLGADRLRFINPIKLVFFLTALTALTAFLADQIWIYGRVWGPGRVRAICATLTITAVYLVSGSFIGCFDYPGGAIPRDYS